MWYYYYTLYEQDRAHLKHHMQHIQEKNCTFKYTYFLCGWYMQILNGFSVWHTTVHQWKSSGFRSSKYHGCFMSYEVGVVVRVLQLQLESDSFCNSAPLDESLQWTSSKWFTQKSPLRKTPYVLCIFPCVLNNFLVKCCICIFPICHVLLNCTIIDALTLRIGSNEKSKRSGSK